MGRGNLEFGCRRQTPALLFSMIAFAAYSESQATVPTIATLSPNPVAVGIGGLSAFPLTVNGGGFATGAVVQWNGMALTTTFVSPARLTASVPASLVSNPATVAITALSGGATSNSASLTVTSSFIFTQAVSRTFTWDGTVNGSVPSNSNFGVFGLTNGTIAATASRTTSGNWLSVSPTSFAPGATLTITVNTNALRDSAGRPIPGAYNGTITVSPVDPSVACEQSPSSLSCPLVVSVTLTVTVVP